MSKLFVGNIPRGSTDTNLSQWVEEHGFGVEFAEIICDRSTGQSRGFGFVMLREPSRVAEAIKVLNGKRMGGRVLTVGQAVPSGSALPESGKRWSA
jgi:nucleolin